MIKIIILLVFAILLADARRHQLDIRVSCLRLSRKKKSMKENIENICSIQHFSPPTKHIQNDIRQYIPLSTFGFYQHGWLMVEIKEFALQHGAENKIVSFAIDHQ